MEGGVDLLWPVASETAKVISHLSRSGDRGMSAVLSVTFKTGKKTGKGGKRTLGIGYHSKNCVLFSCPEHVSTSQG